MVEGSNNYNVNNNNNGNNSLGDTIMATEAML